MNERDTRKPAKGLLGVVALAVILLGAMLYSGVMKGGSRAYEYRPEIRPEIRIPEYRTDAARAIDAYERLMERYMSLSERSFGDMAGDLKGVSVKLESIEGQLRGLAMRIGRIENALGIEPSKLEVPKKNVLKEIEDKGDRASPPKVAEKPKPSVGY